jgi:hypothetical protein
MKTATQLRAELRTWKFAAKKYATLWRKSRKDFREIELTLLLVRAADQRGISMWQEAHPETKNKVWPDRGKMIFWLLEQFDQIKIRVTALEKIARKAGK